MNGSRAGTTAKCFKRTSCVRTKSGAQDVRRLQLARQLLAISEADELVCFNVYPEDVATDVRKLFREYDVRFARKLGLCIHDGGSEKPEYEIRTILSHDFWDDGAWRAGRGKVGRRSGHCRGSDARLAGQ